MAFSRLAIQGSRPRPSASSSLILLALLTILSLLANTSNAMPIPIPASSTATIVTEDNVPASTTSTFSYPLEGHGQGDRLLASLGSDQGTLDGEGIHLNRPIFYCRSLQDDGDVITPVRILKRSFRPEAETGDGDTAEGGDMMGSGTGPGHLKTLPVEPSPEQPSQLQK